MRIYIKTIRIKRDKAYLIARTNVDIIIGQVYKVKETEHYFKVVEIETVNNTICEITLEQCGDKRYFINTSKEAMDIIHDEIILITDKNKLKELESY